MKKLLIIIVLISIFLVVSTTSFSQSEKITLNFIEVLTNPKSTLLIKKIISDYEELHPNIQINLISPPYEAADQKATLMLNTNQPLDIIEVREFTVKQYVNNKKLLNLESYLKSWSDSKTLIPIAWDAARAVDNTAYYVPKQFFIKALYYRTDILKELGINYVPETVSELFDICKKITNPSKNQYGDAFRGKSWEFMDSDLICGSFLDDIDVNNVYKKTDGKAVFNDPRYVEGLKLYLRFFKETAPKDSINWGCNETVNSFMSGTTPFLIQDPDVTVTADEVLGKDKYMVIPMPVGPSGKSYPIYGVSGLGITSYSKHKEEAWEFIKYFSSPEINAYFCKDFGVLPIHSVVYKTDPYFTTGSLSAWAYIMEHPEKYVFAKLPVDSPKWPEWPKIHESDMQSLLLGKVTIEEVVNKWTEYWQ